MHQQYGHRTMMPRQGPTARKRRGHPRRTSANPARDFVWSVADEGYRMAEPPHPRDLEEIQRPLLPDSLQEASLWGWVLRSIFNEPRTHSGWASTLDRDGAFGAWLVEKGQSHSSYHPLEHSALFRVFADVEPTKGAIIRFASRYGLLGRPLLRCEEESPARVQGEPLGKWYRQLGLMRLVTVIWECLRSSDQDRLANHVRWVSRSEVIAINPPVTQTSQESEPSVDALGAKNQAKSFQPAPYVIASADREPELIMRFAYGDIVGPAISALRKIPNEWLKQEVAAQLVEGRGDASLGCPPPLALGTGPTSLLGVLWLQFATAVSENKHYRRCDYCQAWSEVSPREANAERHYCSTAHRMKAYRERQAEAQRLANAGEAVETIAEKLGSDTETIRGWIGKGDLSPQVTSKGAKR
jgi:hypothetical protein